MGNEADTPAAGAQPADTAVRSGRGVSLSTRSMIAALAALFALYGAGAGAAGAWLVLATGMAPVQLAPWDGPSVVGTVAAQVVSSVYTVREVTGPDGVRRDRPGTAVAWRADGMLVTNFHVAGDAGTVLLLGPDGRYLTAAVIGGDRAADVSLLQLGQPVNVPTWSEAVPQVGSLAVTIGAPFGLGGSVTAGIVSATHRDLGSVQGAQLQHMIQFDAPVNPGNSGGPLLDGGGQVIGLVTAIYSVSGVNEGVAFALPAQRVNAVARQLAAGRSPALPLGLLTGDTDAGVLVHDVLFNSAGERAGLLGRDLIVAVDGEAVTTVGQLHAVLETRRAAGATMVLLRVERPGSLTIELALELS